MKSLRPTSANQTRKPSDAALASRYLDLQRLRDEVRKAEARVARHEAQKGLGVGSSVQSNSLACSVRPSDQQVINSLSRP